MHTATPRKVPKEQTPLVSPGLPFGGGGLGAAPSHGHALCPWGLGALSSVPEENALECTMHRNKAFYHIYVTLNPVLLKKNTKGIIHKLQNIRFD